MATWKRFFNTPQPSSYSSSGHSKSSDGDSMGYSNFNGNLREVFRGPANRLERYNQFDQLDRDPIINAALNTIAEFCTQEDVNTKQPFWLNLESDSNETETMVLKESLKKWIYVNDFRKRLFHIFRNTIKYGDVFFIRDPETYELHYIDPRCVDTITIDETQGKEPYSYNIRDISLSLANKIATHDTEFMRQNSGAYGGLMPSVTKSSVSGLASMSPNATGGSPSQEILAKHVVHISLNSTGLDFSNWPFAASILESVYKPAKQKELLENAYMIYTIQRAPERRAFYIYVGDLQGYKAMQFVERVKNELHQRRIPSRDGGAQSVIDGTYDPQSMLEDYYFPVNSEGQGPRVEQLGGGDGIGANMDNLGWFNDQILKGLGIPPSYIPTTNDNDISFNDGKTGVALLQEWRFAQSCKRLQTLVRDVFDFEFKMFCKKRGVIVDSSQFNLEFEEPQSFGEYRQIEKDQAQLSVLTTVDGFDYLSKRFILKRFGGFTEEELQENQTLWKEENQHKVAGKVADLEIHDLEDIDLNMVGVKKPNQDDEETSDDLDMGEMNDEIG